MGLTQIFAHLFVMDRIPELAKQVAADAVTPVFERTAPGLPQIRGSEQVGYIRARAAAVVVPLVEKAIAKGGKKLAHQTERLQTEVMDIVIQAVRERFQQTKSRVTSTRRAA